MVLTNSISEADLSNAVGGKWCKWGMAPGKFMMMIQGMR